MMYGLWERCPTVVSAAWGTRATVDNDRLVFLPDRQSWAGDYDECTKLLGVLNKKILPRIQMRFGLRVRAKEIVFGEEEDIVLFEDECYVAMLGVRGSRLFVQLIAWAK